MIKVMFISSTGGHLSELLQLNSLFSKYDYQIVTEKTKSTKNLTKKYSGHINYLMFGTKDHLFTYPFRLFYNCLKSFYFYLKYQPDVIITTGAHTAGPMCCLGKIFGSKIIYIESFANINTKTLTGRIIYHFADLFVVQWKGMLELYPDAIYGGKIF